MSTENPIFTPEQLEALSALISESRNGIVQDTDSKVRAALGEYNDSISEGIGDTVARAVTENLRVVVAAVQSTVPAVPVATAEAGSKFSREMLIAVVPTILTIFLAFWTWTWQSDIQRKVDVQKEILTSQLSLKEEFFKRKLDVYQDTYNHLAKLVDALHSARRDTTQEERAVVALHDFNEFLTQKKLYINDATHALLQDVRADSTTILAQGRAAPVDGLMGKIEKCGKQLEADLNVGELGHLLKSLSSEGSAVKVK